MEKLPKKVRIIRANMKSYWYSDQIDEIFEVTGENEYGGYSVNYEGTDDKYFVQKYDCEIVREEEPTPQLAGIHDSLASLAVEVTKLKSVVSAFTGQLTPLQLAILNAEDTPADVKLTLIVEAGRLESERQAKLDA